MGSLYAHLRHCPCPTNISWGMETTLTSSVVFFANAFGGRRLAVSKRKDLIFCGHNSKSTLSLPHNSQPSFLSTLLLSAFNQKQPVQCLAHNVHEPTRTQIARYLVESTIRYGYNIANVMKKQNAVLGKALISVGCACLRKNG